jgi:hypothetical protein
MEYIEEGKNQGRNEIPLWDLPTMTEEIHE